jgi:PIN domain nuclease of toxin-antitoxin system
MDDGAVLLLDTCAIIYVALDEGMTASTKRMVEEASTTGRLRISPMSAWEIGMLMSKGRLRSPLTANDFVDRALDAMQARFCDLTPELLIDSSFLPGSPHGDPTDRILMATARKMDMVLVTSDKPILAYGGEGHLRTLAC